MRWVLIHPPTGYARLHTVKSYAPLPGRLRLGNPVAVRAAHVWANLALMLRDVYDVSFCGAATPDPYGDLFVMVLATR
jgi:hypothetical protein